MKEFYKITEESIDEVKIGSVIITEESDELILQENETTNFKKYIVSAISIESDSITLTSKEQLDLQEAKQKRYIDDTPVWIIENSGKMNKNLSDLLKQKRWYLEKNNHY